MYTFIAPLVKSSDFSIDLSLTSYLWVWGLGGVVGSFLVGPVVDKVKGPVLTFAILLILALSLLSLPLLAGMNQWLLMVPVALWGAVGWPYKFLRITN